MDRGRVGANDVEHGVGVGILDRGPAVGGRLGFVHDQQARETLAGGLLVLVGPPAVVGHGLAAEGALPRFEVGVVDQDHAHLAAKVGAFEVVPVPLGRLDAVADEDQGRVLDDDAVASLQTGADGDLLALGEGLASSPDREGCGRLAHDVRLEQRDILGPGPVAPPGLQAGGGELLGQIGDRLGLARRSRRAALELVRRQDADMLRHPGGADRSGDGSCDLLRGAGRKKEGGGEREERRSHGATLAKLSPGNNRGQRSIKERTSGSRSSARQSQVWATMSATPAA
jgi:hypothetical protein